METIKYLADFSNKNIHLKLLLKISELYFNSKLDKEKNKLRKVEEITMIRS